MRKAVLLILCVACCAQLTRAQDDEHKNEFFAGYSYLTTPFDEPDAPLDRFDNLDGFNLSATHYFTKRFGLTADFSAHFANRNEDFPGGTIRFRSRSYNYFVGPQAKFTNHTRVTPFVHALAGAANNRFSYRATLTGATTPIIDATASVTDFALAIGGGLDVRLSKRVALRAFQLDYNPVFLRDRPELNTNGGRRIDNVRFSIGVVFK